jgi:hypothetical protein
MNSSGTGLTETSSLPSLSSAQLVKKEETRRASLPSLSAQLVKEETRRASLPLLAVLLFKEETRCATDAARDCDSLASTGASLAEMPPLPSLSPSCSFSSFSSFTEEATLDDLVVPFTTLSRAPLSDSFDISSITMWDTDLLPTVSSELLLFDE